MPIVTVSSVTGSTGRHVRLPGLPDFNATAELIIEDFDGYMGAAAPSSSLVANGGAPGAVAAGDWLPTEEFLTLTGRIVVGHPSDVALMRSLLAQAIPTTTDTSLIILGNDWDVDKQMFVRRYDRLEGSQNARVFTFAIPLVAPDPYKYALEPLAGAMGVFTGQQWYREYDPVTMVRTYALTSAWSRTYEQSIPSGPYPPALTLSSPGDATSRRVTVTITGPLDAGDWWLLNETTGERLWVEVPVLASQDLVLDMTNRTARLSGSPVDHLVYGDWLSLASGPNLFRLVSGSPSEAFATVSALPAYL